MALRWADDPDCDLEARCAANFCCDDCARRCQAFDVDRFLRKFWGCSLTLKTPVRASVRARLDRFCYRIVCQVGWIHVPCNDVPQAPCRVCMLSCKGVAA